MTPVTVSDDRLSNQPNSLESVLIAQFVLALGPDKRELNLPKAYKAIAEYDAHKAHQGLKLNAPKDITKEQWREYEHGGVTFRIVAPQQLWIGTTTHRVQDASGVVHCHPVPGNGCALRWQPKDANEPVQF